MIRALVLLGLAVALGGCTYVTPAAPCAAAPQAGADLEPGDRVLARWRGGFWQATVLNVQGKLVTVAWDVPPPERSYLPRGWVVKKEVEAPAVEPGQWLLCRQEVWELCRFESMEGGTWKVIFASDGSSAEIDSLDVASVPEDLRSWAARRGDSQMNEALLSETVNPSAPLNAGSPVTQGKKVLARWTDGNWYGGTVSESKGTTVTVEWGDGSPALAIPNTNVAPLPGQGQTLKAGDLAFCRWESSARWWRARIDRVDGSVLAITYRDGTKGKLGPADCLVAE